MVNIMSGMNLLADFTEFPGTLLTVLWGLFEKWKVKKEIIGLTEHRNKSKTLKELFVLNSKVALASFKAPGQVGFLSSYVTDLQ